MDRKHSLIPSEHIERRIFLIRGQKVMLDNDLAALYGVATKTLNRAVKRNIERFPEDFMFQLSPHEYRSLRYQFGTLEVGRGRYRKYRPFVFTEQGVAMLSSVLRSKRAILVNIAIMRAFVKLRALLASHKHFAQKLATVERKLHTHDTQIRSLFDVIRELTKPPAPVRHRIGFHE